MKLSKKAVEFINNFAEGVSVLKNYSGRFMYGNTTDALVVPSYFDYGKLMYEACKEKQTEVQKFLLQLDRSDNFGNDRVLY